MKLKGNKAADPLIRKLKKKLKFRPSDPVVQIHSSGVIITKTGEYIAESWSLRIVDDFETEAEALAASKKVKELLLGLKK